MDEAGLCLERDTPVMNTFVQSLSHNICVDQFEHELMSCCSILNSELGNRNFFFALPFIYMDIEALKR